MPRFIARERGCYQSVKDRKFESNSQLVVQSKIKWLCCYQSVKDRKFESNSQRNWYIEHEVNSCYQSVKDRKFESNSQRWNYSQFRHSGCYQSVKDRKFESNSQRQMLFTLQNWAVISLSKIENLKAIHNGFCFRHTANWLLSVCQR